MSTHSSTYSNESYHTAKSTLSGSYHTASDGSSIKNSPVSSTEAGQVNEVAFNVLISPNLSPAERLSFKLEEHVKTNSQPYTIVSWNGKKYQITVHKDRSMLSYSEEDWNRIKNKMTELWDNAHPEHHFSKGDLNLDVKKWNVTLNNHKAPVQDSKTQQIIKDIKNLLEKELTASHISSSTKSSTKTLEKGSLPVVQEDLSETLGEKTKRKKNSFFFLKPKKIFKQFTCLLNKTKERFFAKSPHANEEFDLTSSSRSSISSQDDCDITSASDTTSIGDISGIEVNQPVSAETNRPQSPINSKEEEGLDVSNTIGGVPNSRLPNDILLDEGPSYNPRPH